MMSSPCLWQREGGCCCSDAALLDEYTPANAQNVFFLRQTLLKRTFFSNPSSYSAFFLI